MLVAFLAIRHLERRPFWLDEATTYFVSGVSWPRLLEVFLGDVRGWHPPTFFVLLKAWRSLFGEGEAALRSMSVAFAVLSVPMTYVVARALVGRWPAVLASVLVACNAFVIQYAQEARTYSLTMFLTLLATWLFLRALGNAGPWIWVAYAAVATLGVYSHLFYGGVVAAHVLAMAAPAFRPARWRWAALGLGVVGLLSAPLVVGSLLGSGSVLDWVDPLTWESVLEAGLALSGGTELTLAAYGISSLAAVAWLAGPGRGSRAWPLVLAWLLVPVLLLSALSLVKPVFVLRYLIVSVPAWTILVAIGVSRLPRPVAAAAAIGLILVSLVGVRDWYQSSFRPWRDVAAYLHHQGAPTDGVLLSRAPFRKPLSHAVIRQDEPVPPLALPSVPWTWNSYLGGERPDTGLLDELAACRLDTLWLIGGPAKIERWDSTALEEVRDGYRYEGSKRFRTIRVHRYDRVNDTCTSPTDGG